MIKGLFLLVSILLITSLSYSKTISLSADNLVLSSDKITPLTYDKDLSSILFKRVVLPKDEPLYFALFSLGGDVDIADLFIAQLNRIPNLYVICVNCNSAAAYMFIQAKNKILLKNSILMTHEIKYNNITTQRLLTLCSNTASIIKKEAQYNNVFFTKFKMSEKEYLTKIQGTEWYIRTPELLKLNIVAEIVSISCSSFIKEIMPNTCRDNK